MALRNLTQFHENPAVVQAWCRVFGRGLVWLTPPARRRRLLAFAALVVGTVATFQTMAKHPDMAVPGSALGTALVACAQFAFFWLVYRAAVNFTRLPAPMRKHPQWSLHAAYWALLVLLWLTPPTSGPWRPVLLGLLGLLGLAIMLPMLLWRLGYLMLAGQLGRMAGTGWHDHAFYLWPAYGGSQTPYGKGLAYLSQHEASTTEALARSQLAGVKLLLLAVVWRLVLTAFEGLLYGSGNRMTAALGGFTVGLPELRNLMAQGADAPWAVSWASVYAELFADVLRLAIKGHLIVGFLRLYGFHVFRNTYKPLLAESVVEFWNRYFYYFKELLVTFFFMPTFTGVGRRFQRIPSLRLLAAVVAAAFVGNVYYLPDQGVRGFGAGVAAGYRGGAEPISARRWDRDQIDKEVGLRVARLQRLGLARADRVLLPFGNRLEFFAELLAIWRLGACAVPIDARLTAFEVTTLVEAARPRLAVVDDATDPAVLAALGQAALPVVQTGDTGAETAVAGLSHLDDDALILFTSGSTGAPKGVVHTHRSLRALWVSLREHLGTAVFARTLCMLPTHFGHGLICNCLFSETGSWVVGLADADVPAEDGLVGEGWGAVVKVLRTADTEQPLDVGMECATGEAGYVWLNTPALMKGYFQRDDLTAKAVIDGWFFTGDIGGGPGAHHERGATGFDADQLATLGSIAALVEQAGT